MYQSSEKNPPLPENVISATIGCNHYKIGLHSKVFVEREGEWLRSDNVTPAEVLQARNEEYRKRKELAQKELERELKRAEK